ncbi:MAG: acyltransferase family protein [Micromonosporaceae bacterium]
MASTTTLPATTESQKTPGSAHGSGDSPGRKRDALLDNAKILLITLVVIGHAVEPTDHGRLGSTAYVWIYLFHMPAFVLICGYLSKSFDGSRHRIDKLLSTVAAPYLIFWTLYAVQAAWADREVPSGPLEPEWLTWFLVALFIWRITAPLWRAVKWPVLVAIAISLVGGLASMGEVLEISRVLSMLPFFVAGLYLQPRHLEFLKQPWVRVCAVAALLAALPLTYLYIEPMSREWVYWRESLLDRDFPFLPYGLPARAVFLLLGFVLTAAVLSLVPRRRMWITQLGEYTMYVYLLHGLVVRLAEQHGWYAFTDDLLGNRGAWVLNASLAVVLVFVLSLPWIRAATRWAVEPNLDWLLRRRTSVDSRELAPAGSR